MPEPADDLATALAALEEAQNTPALPSDCDIGGCRLVCTCPACPEQYDVFDKDGSLKMGYLRLRHGRFRADVPVCGGYTVYESHPEGDGLFNDDERELELTNAVAAIKKWWEELSKSEPG